MNKSKVAVIHTDFFYEEGINGKHKPVLRNIMLSSIKTVECGSIDAKNAIYLKGFKDAPIENIVLENIDLNGVSGEAVLQNVKNLTFRNVFINGDKIEDKTINVDNNFNIN